MENKKVLIRYEQGKGAITAIRTAIIKLYRSGSSEFVQLENGLHLPLEKVHSVDGVCF